MSMRDRSEVEPLQVDAECRRVFGKRSRIVAGVKEEALSSKLEQRRKAPILPQPWPLAERVMKDGYAIARHVRGLT
jgi:hypothetical protein